MVNLLRSPLISVSVVKHPHSLMTTFLNAIQFSFFLVLKEINIIYL